MANPKLRFRFFEPDVDTNLPLTDGTVTIDGFDLERVSGPADAWDQGMGQLPALLAAGEPIVCIPAFPNRKFRLSYIQVNAKAGIESAKDLEGKRVGIHFWGNTAGVWARGALQNYYHVDLARIDWLAARPEPPPHLPAGIKIRPLPEHTGPADLFMDALLVDGELDAVIGPNVLPSITRRDPRVRRLFRDYKQEEETYFKQTGIFPISHVIAMDRGFVERHPEAPTALLRAYRQARDVAFNRIEGSDPVILTISWAAAAMAEQRALMGERYWAYNIDDNRRSLDAFTEFAYQQGLSPTKPDYMSFFHPEAAALPGW
ncbi:MAG TPA: ABC transporter substrate-binding protein [Chloroflexota bacterium]|nr:ABC transporter substrate-binding protein [Chloroflexota bacterium]